MEFIKMKRFKKIFSNKYLLVTISLFVWILFFDKNNLIDQWQLNHQLNDAKQKENYYKDEIRKTEDQKHALTTDPSALEQFAREKYHMKKDNEDEFVIVPDSLKK
jgi:cell division protein FtsB